MKLKISVKGEPKIILTSLEGVKSGDEIRIVAPSRSLAIISKDTRIIGDARFKELGLKLSFGKHVNEMDDFASSSIKSRVQDLHDAC